MFEKRKNCKREGETPTRYRLKLQILSNLNKLSTRFYGKSLSPFLGYDGEGDGL